MLILQQIYFPFSWKKQNTSNSQVDVKFNTGLHFSDVNDLKRTLHFCGFSGIAKGLSK